MADPHPARPGERPEREDKRSLFQKLVEFIRPGPDSTDELIGTLAEAEDNEVIDAESRVMLEGVLRMADMTAGDAMVAAPRMDLLDIDAPYEDMLLEVIRTAHSRFPVYQGERENIIGILMSKDLLKLQRAPELNVRTLLRPAVFVPESKGLNELLRAFRVNRNHLAIVVDEFGRTAGLITIEDVLRRSSARSRTSSTSTATRATSSPWPTTPGAWPATRRWSASTNPSACTWGPTPTATWRSSSTPSAA